MIYGMIYVLSGLDNQVGSWLYLWLLISNVGLLLRDPWSAIPYELAWPSSPLMVSQIGQVCGTLNCHRSFIRIF